MASIRRCRRCGELFVPGLFGINLFVVRIRRCSVCGKLTPLFIWGDGPAAQQSEENVQKEKATELDEEEVLKRRIEESKYDRS
jgi:hypothetical protein